MTEPQAPSRWFLHFLEPSEYVTRHAGCDLMLTHEDFSDVIFLSNSAS